MRNAVLFVVLLMLSVVLLIYGCGGKSDDGLEPWEISHGMCAFDDKAAFDTAMRRGASCTVILYGKNTWNGQPWPSKTWPSSPQAEE